MCVGGCADGGAPRFAHVRACVCGDYDADDDGWMLIDVTDCSLHLTTSCSMSVLLFLMSLLKAHPHHTLPRPFFSRPPFNNLTDKAYMLPSIVHRHGANKGPSSSPTTTTTTTTTRVPLQCCSFMLLLLLMLPIGNITYCLHSDAYVLIIVWQSIQPIPYPLPPSLPSIAASPFPLLPRQ